MNFEEKQIIDKALEDSKIKKMLADNKLPISFLENNILSIDAYLNRKHDCLNCRGLALCKQSIKGYEPNITYTGNINLDFIPCSYLQQMTSSAAKELNLKTIGCSIHTIDASQLVITKERNEIYQKMGHIHDAVIANKHPKGLFITGSFGCGKTYICEYVANQFAQNGYNVLFVYYPNLVRQIKSEIIGGDVEKYVAALKEADILFIDDFGGEINTPYIRDEVLGAILQERMTENKLTFMTSNLSREAVHEHLKETSNTIDDIRASRIEERINYLMEFITLTGKNYRY